MTFSLENADATYQWAMNLIFHDLLGIILEIDIDDVVVKSDSVIPRSEKAEMKPPYVCPGCLNHTYSNNMINKFHVH
jgi:hypothetical protein